MLPYSGIIFAFFEINLFLASSRSGSTPSLKSSLENISDTKTSAGLFISSPTLMSVDFLVITFIFSLRLLSAITFLAVFAIIEFISQHSPRIKKS